MAEFDTLSADGTSVRAWVNDAEGEPLLVCNGLGTSPWAWPALHDPTCGFRAMTWWHRGTGRSERPLDPRRVTVHDHVADAVALLDAQATTRALVAAWSIGVNVALELALRHPDRVTGILAVAGVPGGTFRTMLGPLGVPSRLRDPLASGAARALRAGGPVLTPLAGRIARLRAAPRLVRHSGFMLPRADPVYTDRAVRAFLDVDVDWYAQLALAAREHVPVDLQALEVPVTYLAGRWDVLTSAADVRAAAARTPDARVAVLPGSHFLPLERPWEVHEHLRLLASRARRAERVS